MHAELETEDLRGTFRDIQGHSGNLPGHLGAFGQPAGTFGDLGEPFRNQRKHWIPDSSFENSAKSSPLVQLA